MQAFAALAFVVLTVSYPIPFPSRHEGHPSPVDFRLPVRGEWTVAQGGDACGTGLLARTRADRRWGLDLLVTDPATGELRRGASGSLDDWLAFGRAVLAPADGSVVRAHDDEPDLPPEQWTFEGEELGNYLVLEVAPEEYVFLAHLRRGSLGVRAGERVERGQELAEVGSSGYSRATPWPHLALHLQDTPEPRWGQGIPWRFAGYRVADGERASGFPEGPCGGARWGQRLEVP